MHIHSGQSDVAGQEIALKATVSKFILLFQEDLETIFTAFKSSLGVDKVYNRVVPKPSKAKFIMIRWAANSANAPARKAAYSFLIIIGRSGSQTVQSGNPDTFAVEWTVEKVLRLLQANGNFNRHAGISELVSIEGGITAPEAFGIQGTNLEIASLLVTYSRDEPQLYPSNK